jgi:hypothetical protein
MDGLRGDLYAHLAVVQAARSNTKGWRLQAPIWLPQSYESYATAFNQRPSNCNLAACLWRVGVADYKWPARQQTVKSYYGVAKRAGRDYA